MVLGTTTSRHLLRNARAIAHLFGEAGRPPETAVTAELINAIDRLTTLYAYGKLDRETLASLSETEARGMATVSGFLNYVREMEIALLIPAGYIRIKTLVWFLTNPAAAHGDRILLWPTDRNRGCLLNAQEIRDVRPVCHLFGF